MEGTEFGVKRRSLRIQRKSKTRKIGVRGEVGEQLLPGIPNEITLNHVAPKLPWTTFHMLSSVSSGWQHAIQSRQVYDARVRTHSMQVLVATIVNQMHDKTVRALALFSLSDGSRYHLPPIPGVSRGIPLLCQCRPLHGKLYVLGGIVGTISRGKEIVDRVSKKVYVFDLLGQKQWKECASMGEPRAKFGCGVINGKIYVFGGNSGLRKFGNCRSEAYDPKADVWSPIAPTGSRGSYHERVEAVREVVAVGEELFVHMSKSVVPYDVKGFLEVYNPLKNQWRNMGRVDLIKMLEKLLVVGGKLHKLNKDGIDIYDTGANAWKPLQSCSFGVLEPTVPFKVQLHAALAVDDDELFGVMYRTHDQGKMYLMRSQGLGCQNKEIEWRKLDCSLSFDECQGDFYGPIQL